MNAPVRYFGCPSGHSQARNETVTPLTEQRNGKRWKIVPNAAEVMSGRILSPASGPRSVWWSAPTRWGGKCRSTSVRSGTATSGPLPPTRIWGSWGLNGGPAASWATSCEAVGSASARLSAGHTTSFALDGQRLDPDAVPQLRTGVTLLCIEFYRRHMSKDPE